MNAADLAFAPAWKVRDMVASKEVSPRELVDLFLDRIQSLDPKLNSYLTVTADLARETAAEAEAAVARGDDLGPSTASPSPSRTWSSPRASAALWAATSSETTSPTKIPSP